MVTSFRPKCHTFRDDTVLTTVRPVSDLSELYYQFSEYRLEILEERIRNQLKTMRDTERSGRKTNTKALKAFLHDQEMFLAHMSKELVDDEFVTKGSIDESQFCNGSVKGKSEKVDEASAV